MLGGPGRACQCRRRAGPGQRRDLRGGHAGGVLTPASHTQGKPRLHWTPSDLSLDGRRVGIPASRHVAPHPGLLCGTDSCLGFFFPRFPRASLVIKTGLGQCFKGLAHHRLPFGALPQRGWAGSSDPELTQRPFAMSLPTPTSSVSGSHPGTPGPSPCPRGPGPDATYGGPGSCMCPSRGRVLSAPLEVTGQSVSVHLAPPGHSSLLLDPETPPFASWGDSPHPTSSMKALVAELYPFVHKAGTSC